MNSSRSTPFVTALLLGAAAFGWTMAGETANPQLTAADLPSSLLERCESASCESRWVGRTPRGDLFIVKHDDCMRTDCSRWMVEKTASTTRVLLELSGRYQLRRANGYYPAVELRTRDDASGTMAVRYEWNGHQYAQTLAQQVYEINGVECGTRDECQAAARGALESQDTDRALVIWQHVWGISWI